MKALLQKKGFICDMDGVIYHGDRLLPGVREFVDWLYAEKKEFLFLTNNSAKTQRDTMGQQLEEQKKENSDLESDLGKANDKEFIKGLAKDQLGLAGVGERIFYDVNH